MAHSPSCMSVGKQISPTCSPKKCAMVQTSDASEILSCVTQAITTSAYTVLLTALLCLQKWHSILNCLVLAFLRFSSLTGAFVFWRPSPAFHAEILGDPYSKKSPLPSMVISLVWPTPPNYPVTKYLDSQGYKETHHWLQPSKNRSIIDAHNSRERLLAVSLVEVS